MFRYLLTMNSLVPIVMVVFGRLWKDNPPKNINGIYGYRTYRSMRNDETWKFAHEYHGRIWRWTGTALLAGTIILMLLFRTDEGIEMKSLWITFIQIAVMLLSILPTERALGRKFDKNGEPR